ncbi:MAG TPA: class D sortase [Thermoanaerobaculia bacterium]|jgi:sortase A|nr:class D sortase [Thermoanaerobaculia bacterium]
MSTQPTLKVNFLLRWLERGLLLVAILCLGGWAWAWLDAKYTQAHDSQILDEARSNGATAVEPAQETDRLDTFQPAANNPEPPPRRQLAEGSLFGRIAIPRLDVSTIVLEGVDAATLRRGAGHIPETALPGDHGNVGIAAHRDSFFRGLKDVRKNDIVRLETLDGTYRYRVDWTRIVTPDETEVLADTGDAELTLVTCYPFYYVGSAPNRFIVRAIREP